MLFFYNGLRTAEQYFHVGSDSTQPKYVPAGTRVSVHPKTLDFGEIRGRIFHFVKPSVIAFGSLSLICSAEPFFSILGT